jgi:hypothetical protein
MRLGKKRKLWGAPAEGVDRRSPFYRALKAWERAMDDWGAAEAALGVLQERVRVARIRCDDRSRRARQALVCGQEAFARGLLDAARAHAVAGREAEALLADGERRLAELRTRADALYADVLREGELYAAERGEEVCDSSLVDAAVA